MKRHLWVFLLLGVLSAGVFFWKEGIEKRNISSPPVATPSFSSEKAPPPFLAPPPEEASPAAPTQILYHVPFTSQAPLAEWQLALFQNACEEASVLIASNWVHGGGEFTKEGARTEIAKMSEWEVKKIGHSIDTDAADTEKYLLNEYEGISNSELMYDFSLADLKQALEKGIIIVPTNGQKLGNPNFKHPGPLTHMLVIIGYDPQKKEFITDDPGTRLGAGYRYNENILYSAIRDYPTGKHLPITGERKAMIVVPKP